MGPGVGGEAARGVDSGHDILEVNEGTPLLLVLI